MVELDIIGKSSHTIRTETTFRGHITVTYKDRPYDINYIKVVVNDLEGEDTTDITMFQPDGINDEAWEAIQDELDSYVR